MERRPLPGAGRYPVDHRKVNLATHERGRLAAGSELPVLQLRLDGGPLTVGVQLCREIVFPEQWRYLAEAGAQAFIYLTNAANPAVRPESGPAT